MLKMTHQGAATDVASIFWLICMRIDVFVQFA